MYTANTHTHFSSRRFQAPYLTEPLKLRLEVNETFTVDSVINKMISVARSHELNITFDDVKNVSFNGFPVKFLTKTDGARLFFGAATRSSGEDIVLRVCLRDRAPRLSAPRGHSGFFSSTDAAATSAPDTETPTGAITDAAFTTHPRR